MSNDQFAIARPTSIWPVWAAFVAAGVLCAFIVSVIAVYLLGWHDPKFANALNSALQIALLDMAISLLVGGVVFILVLAIMGPGESGFGSAWRAGVWGAVYPIGMVLLERVLVHFDPESLATVVVGLGCMALYPAAAAFAIKKRPS